MRFFHRPGSQVLLCLFLTVFPAMALDPASVYQPRNFSFQNQNYQYRLLAPRDQKPGVKYPLVLYLHGAGERGEDNAIQLRHLPARMAEQPYREQFNAFVLVPQCREGKRWVEVDWGARRSSRMKARPSLMMAMTMALLDKTLQENPVDLSRVYLAGISMGGYGAWELAARKPGFFAAVLAVCGGGDEQTAPLLKSTAFWAWHGLADDIVPPERSRRMIEALRATGGTGKLTELPGIGHDSWTKAFAPESAALLWLFEQRR